MESQAPRPTSSGSRCVLHDGKPFVTLCHRCGTYMCQECTQDGAFRECVACRSEQARRASAFPLRRDTLHVSALLQHTFRVFGANWGLFVVGLILSFALMLVGFSVLAGLVSVLASALSLTWPVDALTLFTSTLGPPLAIAGLAHMAICASRGEAVSLRHLLPGWKAFGRYATLLMLLTVLIASASLLVVSPLLLIEFEALASLTIWEWALFPLGFVLVLVLHLSLCFAPLEGLTHPELSVVDAFKNAYRLTRSRRLVVLGYGALSWLFVCIGTAFCLVGLVVAVPFIVVLMSSLYLALRNGTQGLKSS